MKTHPNPEANVVVDRSSIGKKPVVVIGQSMFVERTEGQLLAEPQYVYLTREKAAVLAAHLLRLVGEMK